jgi:DMSO reductase family type II enzyme heme b subunit
MPAWKGALTETELRDVAAYIKTFSKRFASETPGRAIEIAPLPKTPESLKNGEKAYLNTNCFLCHGMKGRGDGDVGIYRRDAADQNNKVSAADLSKRWNFRTGPRLEDIYKSIMTGLTLMPSHEKSFGEGPAAKRQAWDLAYYVDSLSREKSNATGVLTARKVPGALPTTEKDPVWDTLAAQDVFVAGQLIRKPRHYEPSVDMISVRGLFNSKELALLLEWNDPRKNIAPIPDSLQLQFPLPLEARKELPHFLEGDSGRPALLWKWDARSETLSALRASGPAGSKKPLPSADLSSSASYGYGRWRLLIKRKLDPGFPLDRPIPVSFSVWDGDPGEREEEGLKRALSGWNALVLLSSPESGAPPLPWAKAVQPEPPRFFRFRGKQVEYAKIKNPYKDLQSSAPSRFAQKVEEGKALYAQKCLSCHGGRLDGQGPFAKAFYPRPASFKVHLAGEAYLFWRIATGGPGLPKAARPWSSAMPAWGDELEEDAIWSLILYLYGN